MTSPRVLVCGGRAYGDREHVFETLDRCWRTIGVEMLIHGDAPGADAHADAWANNRVIPCLRVPADWDSFGPGAGPKRNRLMLEIGAPKFVLAFPGGRGTADMVKQARDAGLKVYEIAARRPE